MARPFIVLGDRTDHGGTVVGASAVSDTGGRGIARVGDHVSCPRCRGVHVIAQGDASMIIDGQPAAYQGCKTTCGAALIASQFVSTTDPSGGAAVGTAAVAAAREAGDSLAKGLGNIGSGLLAGYQEDSLDDERQRFRGRFQMVDGESGEPIVGHAVRVRSTAGQYLTGTTDAEGFTAWVERDAAEHLAFDLMEGPGSGAAA